MEVDKAVSEETTFIYGLSIILVFPIARKRVMLHI